MWKGEMKEWVLGSGGKHEGISPPTQYQPTSKPSHTHRCTTVSILFNIKMPLIAPASIFRTANFPPVLVCVVSCQCGFTGFVITEN